ncbi:MAG: RecX family transcriptional regulator [Clostridia bacterium]|nr:RecX family transcriptional regulator [Clostridia bacterium]
MTTDRKIELSHVRAADGGARLLLHIKILQGEQVSREILTVFAARLPYVPQCGVLRGDEYERLVAESKMTGALDMGLRLLGAGAVSQLRLIQKMRQRGVEKEIAAAAAAELFARGYADETAGALREAEKGIGKLWGDRRILLDVRAKGYGEAALSAVKKFLLTQNAAGRCEKLIARRRMTVSLTEADASRFVSSLVRYGYTVHEIKQAISQKNEH